jgi:hypothetical protein
MRLVGDGEGLSAGGPPAFKEVRTRLVCPGYFNDEQRRHFYKICRRLESQDLLLKATLGMVVMLAILEAEIERTTRFLNENGMSYTALREGQPYKCKVCKGSGVQPGSSSTTEVAAGTEISHSRGDPRGRRCSICGRPELGLMDAALASGRPLRAIARQFATTKDSLSRHKRDHLGKQFRRAASAAVGGDGPPCRACNGTGQVMSKGHAVLVQYAEVAQRKAAVDQATRISANLGLDTVSIARLKGTVAKPPSAGGLREMMKHRAKVR